jgi:flagellar basal-body rod modification protein FlgD
MAADITSSLPTNLLTTKQYEDQQAKLVAKEDDLGRDAFLQLFTTQLKNQNPLDPMDNEAFVSQLAQFSSLEAMTGVRTSVDAMAEDSKSEKFLLGSNLLGKKLGLVGGSVSAGGGKQTTSQANLTVPAQSGEFSIFDASTNALIYSKTFTNLPAGNVDLKWNGQDSAGEDAPEGMYKFDFVVNRGDEKSTIPLVNEQVIKAVSWDNEIDEMKIEMEDGRVLSMADVRRVQI